MSVWVSSRTRTGKSGRDVAEAEAEARDEAGRLAIARRVDVAQEVVGLVGEAGLQGAAVAARQDRDQVRLAGLARAEHAGAHAAAGGAASLRLWLRTFCSSLISEGACCATVGDWLAAFLSQSTPSLAATASDSHSWASLRSTVSIRV
jgi:hypothetical protein